MSFICAHLPSPWVLVPFLLMVAAVGVVLLIRPLRQKWWRLTLARLAGQLGLVFHPRRRRDAFAALAGRLGFMFDPERREDLPSWCKPFELFRRGSPEGTLNHLAGWRNDLFVEVFDYEYEQGSGDSRTTYTRVVVVLETPASFPMLLIKPDTALREFFECIGGSDIDFESNEFNRRFYVKAEDRAFAFQVVHAQMMQFLMTARIVMRGIGLQMHGDRVVFYRDTELKPNAVGLVLEFALGFYARIPDHVKKDYART